MTPEAILLPMCVLALWTLCVLALVPVTRVRAGNAGRVHIKDFRYGESANVPGDVSLPNRNFMNLLELPVLFYVLVLALYATKRADDLFVYMAWAFVAARVAHSLIHIGYNNIAHRGAVFGIGVMLMFVMWARFTWGLVG